MVAYFVTGILKNPPTAFDELLYERVKVFSALHVPAKIIAVGFSPDWLRAAQIGELTPDQVISVFDQLQAVPKLPVQPLLLEDFHELDDTEQEWREHQATYLRQGKLYAKVDTGADGSIRAVNFYDSAGRVERCEVYDARGFKSQIFHYTANHLDEVDYLTPTGRIAIVQDFGKIVRTSVLATHKNYASFNDFAMAMLMQIIQPGDFVIAERPEYQPVVANLPVAIQRGYDLADAELTVKPQPKDLVLTRRFRPDYPQAKVFDEFAADAQLQKGWRRLLGGIGIVPSKALPNGDA